jgi:tetratricopeptide (TPR) repeat protein
MRFAEHLRRASALPSLGAIAAAALLCSGCATIGEPLKALKDAVTPGPSAAASAPSTAQAAAQPAAAKRAPDAPVALAVQRSYDDALRLLRAGRVDEAERAFRAIAQANPDLGGPHANLGAIYRQQNKLAESASELEQAVKINPNQPIYFNQLGITYRQLGQFNKAREAYESAIALDAAYAAPILNLGILYDLYLGDGPRALEFYGRYLALSPSGDPAVTKWMAELKNRKQSQATTVSMKEKA